MIEGKKLIITGSGPMYDYAEMYMWDETKIPWYSSRASITNVTLPNGITYLSTLSFNGFTSLVSISLPDSVKEIGHNLFADCTKLSSVRLPKDIRFSQTDQFDPPPVWPKDKEFTNCWHLRAATKPSYETTFLTVLQPHRNSDFTPRPSVKLLESDTAQGVEAVYDDGSKAIILFARQNIKGNAIFGNI